MRIIQLIRFKINSVFTDSYNEHVYIKPSGYKACEFNVLQAALVRCFNYCKRNTLWPILVERKKCMTKVDCVN